MPGRLKLTDIRTDGDTQSRERLCQDTIAEYQQAYQNGDILPPVVVFDDGENYWLSDGFHRKAGAEKAELVELPVEVKQGSAWDAFLYGVKANDTHGLRRSNVDKRYAVERILDSPEYNGTSQRQVAVLAGVSHELVNIIVRERKFNEKAQPVSKPARGTTTVTQEYDAEDFVEEDEEAEEEVADDVDPMQITVDECATIHREAKAKVNEARRLMEGLAQSQSYLRDVIGRIKRDLKQASTAIHQMEPQDFKGSEIITRADLQTKG